MRRVKLRRIDANAAMGLEKLGHAIEYLADETVYEGWEIDDKWGRADAIRILMSLNRSIYFSSPEPPSFWQRICAML